MFCCKIIVPYIASDSTKLMLYLCSKEIGRYISSVIFFSLPYPYYKIANSALRDQFLHVRGYPPFNIDKIPFHAEIVEIYGGESGTKLSFATLPKNVKELRFSSFAGEVIDLPTSVISLDFIEWSKTPENIPDHIKKLAVHSINKESKFPKSLEYLIISHYNYNLHLPDTLTKLEIITFMWGSFKELPKSLDTLIIRGGFYLEFKDIPNTVKTLVLGESFNRPIDKLPDFLEELDLGKSFNHPIKDLPSTLISLKSGMSSDKYIDNLPESLKHLVIKNNRVKINALPRSLLTLEINGESIDPKMFIYKN